MRNKIIIALLLICCIMTGCNSSKTILCSAVTMLDNDSKDSLMEYNQYYVKDKWVADIITAHKVEIDQICKGTYKESFVMYGEETYIIFSDKTALVIDNENNQLIACENVRYTITYKKGTKGNAPYADYDKDTALTYEVNEINDSEEVAETVVDTTVVDKKHTKVKFITDEDYSFEDDFILQYTEEIPEYKELINISNYYVKEYDLGDDGYVCIIREEQESRVVDTCIYYTMSDFEPCDKDTLYFGGYVPNEDDYEFSTVEQDDITIVTYADTLDDFTDWGTKYYDSDGHLLVWEYYLTSGCREMFFIWDGDNVAMTIDTGGQAWDSDDEGALIGIDTTICKFNEPIPLEEIVKENQ